MSCFVMIVSRTVEAHNLRGNVGVSVNDLSQLVAPPKKVRSRVSNGSTLHAVEVDGRTAEARRFRDVFHQIVADLGGSEALSEAQRQLARRATLLSIKCELMEADAVNGADIDLDG